MVKGIRKESVSLARLSWEIFFKASNIVIAWKYHINTCKNNVATTVYPGFFFACQNICENGGKCESFLICN